MTLRDRGVRARLLLLGDREERELPWCIDYDLTCCVSEPYSVAVLGQLAARAGKRVPVHLKINTGMNRYGVRWNEAASLAALIGSTKSLLLEGVLSHFAQSDESDKTFALQQLAHFEQAMREIAGLGLAVRSRIYATAADFWICPRRILTWSAWAFCRLGCFLPRFAGVFRALSRS